MAHDSSFAPALCYSLTSRPSPPTPCRAQQRSPAPTHKHTCALLRADQSLPLSPCRRGSTSSWPAIRARGSASRLRARCTLVGDTTAYCARAVELAWTAPVCCIWTPMLQQAGRVFHEAQKAPKLFQWGLCIPLSPTPHHTRSTAVSSNLARAHPPHDTSRAGPEHLPTRLVGRGAVGALPRLTVCMHGHTTLTFGFAV